MGKKILWIEDDAYELEPLTWPLSDAGFEIHTALDAFDAINEIRDQKNKYDLIILDILLPTGEKNEINKVEYVGANLLEEIRKLDKNIPVIAFTVVRDSELHEKLNRLGVKKIFTKGAVLSSDLLNAIIKILGE
jgi:DNA-binding response OmpR family regulator